MPIVNAFDQPQGGANGGFTPGDSGGGGGGASFVNIELETLDISSGWTKIDKDDMEITGQSYTAGGTGTYTLGDSAGGLQYTATRASYPIAYRQAYAIAADGSQTLLTTDSTFNVRVRFSDYQAVPTATGFLIFGLTTDPTTTDHTVFHVMAAGVKYTNAFTPWRAAIVSINNFTTIGTSNARTYSADLVYVGGSANRQVNVTGYTTESDGSFDNNGQRNSNKDRTSGQPIYFVFGYVTASSGISTTAGDTIAAKIEYKAINYGGV